jgi:hypothetical protein
MRVRVVLTRRVWKAATKAGGLGKKIFKETIRFFVKFYI